ncbi:MAG: T9SS type A sorting domain-containing protein, partial [Saprospiraceae bacterium]|nr:T9SS type A sorting domain-containing protein [Saprospiraceae bacterium]
VYPTLSEGLVYVTNDFNREATVNWTLFDVTGRRIEAGEILVNQESETEINLNKLANGLYFIRFTEGILEKTFRIVISHT